MKIELYALRDQQLEAIKMALNRVPFKVFELALRRLQDARIISKSELLVIWKQEQKISFNAKNMDYYNIRDRILTIFPTGPP